MTEVFKAKALTWSGISLPVEIVLFRNGKISMRFDGRDYGPGDQVLIRDEDGWNTLDSIKEIVVNDEKPRILLRARGYPVAEPSR